MRKPRLIIREEVRKRRQKTSLYEIQMKNAPKNNPHFWYNTKKE